ncbi:MAG: quinone-dependent dihydroorotate dehydrogenase [Candidatus Colwellbacteria bacterium]|nr:quinone-dependent dihydroorotate dehydrogenase [Candidatus Colwellbacteria bacterium]
MLLYRDVFFPILSLLDEERVHNLALRLMRLAGRSARVREALHNRFAYQDPRLEVELFGLRFKNPVGFAAGLDKNGIAVPALAAFGFGFGEVGTVLPIRQPGEKKPRIWRLAENGVLINRMGFPSDGREVTARNLSRVNYPNFILWVNVGPNKESVAAGRTADDCTAVARRLWKYALAIVINLSSPNTPGLRDEQRREGLTRILIHVTSLRDALGWKPILVKLSPDMSWTQMDEALTTIMNLADGVVAGNTTISRNGLTSLLCEKPGGASGRILTRRTPQFVEYIYRQTNGRIPIVAVGGIFTAEDVWQNMTRGATLVEIFTSFVSREGGPSLPGRICYELSERLDREGINSIHEVIGSAAKMNR